jgi:hypothetical protein
MIQTEGNATSSALDLGSGIPNDAFRERELIQIEGSGGANPRQSTSFTHRTAHVASLIG